MRIVNRYLNYYEGGVEVIRGEHGTVILTVSYAGEYAHTVLDQTTALTVARMIEKQVEDIRRRE